MRRKRNPPKLLVGMEIGAATMENKMKFSEKETKNKTTIGLVNSTQTNLKKNTKNKKKPSSKRYLHSNVHSSIIFSCQDMGVACVSIPG